MGISKLEDEKMGSGVRCNLGLREWTERAEGLWTTNTVRAILTERTAMTGAGELTKCIGGMIYKLLDNPRGLDMCDESRSLRLGNLGSTLYKHAGDAYAMQS